MDANMDNTKYYVTAENARAFVTAVLRGNGVDEEDSNTVARCLIEADLRGVDTHGKSMTFAVASEGRLQKLMNDQEPTGYLAI